MAKTTIVIGSSQELKDALEQWAFDHNVSANEAARRAISAFVGYDLEAEKANRIERRGRPRKYATEVERKAAAANRSREQRKVGRELVAAYRRQQTQADMERFRKSVEDKYGKEKE